MKLRPIPDDERLPDGVYIGLPEARYFPQGLGSSDLATLWLAKEGWWWQSPNNPFYVRKPSDPQDFGSGLHCKGLEGPEAFAARYFIAPNPLDFPGLLVTQPELYSAVSAAPDAPKVAAKSRKSDLIEMAKVYCPDRPIWDVIQEKAERKAAGRTVLSTEQNWHLDVMIDAAMQDEMMRAVCTAEGGVRLTEVSVFWTLPSGTRLRFRFDSLLPACNADLKSIDNYRAGKRLGDAVGEAIGNRAMDVQAAMSFTARRAAYALIEAGQIFIDPQPLVGDPEQQLAWLRRFPKEAPLDLDGQPGWYWLWMFFQKPDNTGRAPTMLPVRVGFGSARHRDGYRKASHGLAFYERMVAERGLERPWTRVEPLHHMDAASDPATEIRTPPWVEQPMAVLGEEQELSWRAT